MRTLQPAKKSRIQICNTVQNRTPIRLDERTGLVVRRNVSFPSLAGFRNEGLKKIKMTTDKEKASLKDEYFQGPTGDEDDDDEAEFDPGDEDSDAGANFGSSEDDDEDEEEGIGTVAILVGDLEVNEEKYVIFSGTWKHKHAGKDSHPSKFKLKSKIPFTAGFDLLNPNRSTSDTIFFDGFFLVQNNDEILKIREKDVQISFFPVKSGDCLDFEHNEKNEKLDSLRCIRFHVSGSGANEYGQFVLSGEYKVPIDIKHVNENSLVCEKKYQSQSTNRKRRRDYFDDDHIPSEDDEPADSNELASLYEEATMTVEELRQRYSGNGATGRSGSSAALLVASSSNSAAASSSSVARKGGEDSDDEYTF